MRTLNRTEVDATRGPLLLEFGAAWCGICRSTEPMIAEWAGRYPEVRHIKVEDAPGEALGRSFGVKLWPTLVFLHDGREVARVVRPRSGQELGAAFRRLVEPELVNRGPYPATDVSIETPSTTR